MRLFPLHIVGLLLLFTAGWAAAESADRPNVVLIYADDMGYGEVEALNPDRSNIPTPFLNRLAHEGMVFTDAHTTSSVCTPSRYSLLTGRYNWRTRLQSSVVQGNEDPLIADGRQTLGHLFQDQGYRTAIVGKWHLSYNYEVPDGVALPERPEKTNLAPYPVGTRIPDGPITRGFDSYFGFHHSRHMSSIVRQDEIAEEIEVVDVLPVLTDEAVRLIGEFAEPAKNGQPFFLYFPQSSPHTPIAPAEEWIGKGGIGKYSDFIAQTDGSVGAVMRALEEHGLADNTLLIFSCDNGTSNRAKIDELQAKGHYPSAGLRGSKSDLWEGGHRVPFIVRWPGEIEAGSASHQFISLMDLMATFGEMFGVEFDDATAEDSVSFLNAFSSQPATNPRTTMVHHSFTGKFAVRQGDWKLLLAPGSGGWTDPRDPKAAELGLPLVQLYNLNDDLGETTNLLEQHPGKAHELIALLQDIVADGRSTPGEPQQNDVPIDLWKGTAWPE